jgi:fructose-bisphosphate aldolase class I
MHKAVHSLQETRRGYREVFMGCPGLGEFVSGVILFKETLYQSTADGKPFVKCLAEQGIAPGIKTDEVRSCTHT